MAVTKTKKTPLPVHETSQQVRVHRGTYLKLTQIAVRNEIPRNAALDMIVAAYWVGHGYDRP